MAQELAIREQHPEAIAGINDVLQPEALIRQVALIQQIMKSVMKKDEHYGIIPGTDKPTLLKPGAEKLNMTFRFSPSYRIEVIDLPSPQGAYDGHREYRITCTLTHIPSGLFMGEGVGSASTLETKWRFRAGPTKLTDRPVPQEYWNIRKTKPEEAQKLLGGRGFITKKDDSGKWMIAEKGERVEFDNPADYYNTCLKMSKKRALVDATLTATAASDIFAQDLEEMQDLIGAMPGAAVAEEKTTVAPPQEKAAGGEPQEKAAGTEQQEKATEPQIKKLCAMLSGAGYKKDEERHKYASSVLSRPIGSFADLTKDEASRLLDIIEKQMKEAAK